jgi:Type IX secretion system membrane protein PorP/SprF
MKKIRFLLALLLFSLPAFSQQTWTNGFFPFNRFIFNPAFTALNEKLQVDAQYGINSFVYSGLPKQLQINGQYQIPSIHSGLGINAFSEVAGEGEYQRNNISLSYSYRHFIGKSQKYQMSYGLNGGYNQIIGIAYYYPYTSPTKILLSNVNIGAGTVFSAVNEKLSLGLASTNLISLSDNKYLYLSPPPNINASYRFDFRKWSIQPYVWIRTGRYNQLFAIATQFQYRWLNVGIGMNNYPNAADLFASAQITIKKHWQIGYVYHYALSGLQAGRDLRPQMLSLSYRRK